MSEGGLCGSKSQTGSSGREGSRKSHAMFVLKKQRFSHLVLLLIILHNKTQWKRKQLNE